MSGSLARHAPLAWRAFAAFLQRPTLPDRARGPSLAGFAAIGRLFALDLLLMGLLIGSFGLLTLFGFELPAHALDGLDLGPVLIAFILVGAPIGEEIVFRSWLSGRPGHIGALLATVAGASLALLAVRALPSPLSGLAAIGLPALTVATVVSLLWFGRTRPAWRWFQQSFRWWYLASALAFAAIHLFNFAGAGAAMLPLTLPQFVLGLILGYLRVNHGLWSSMTFHALHNSVFIGLVLAAGGAGG